MDAIGWSENVFADLEVLPITGDRTYVAYTKKEFVLNSKEDSAEATGRNLEVCR